MPPAATAPVKPSRWWFLAAGLIAVVAIGGALALIGLAFYRYESRIDGFDRVRVPGTMQVRLEKAGGYSIYHEFLGADTTSGDSLGDPVDETVFRTAPAVTVVSPAGETLDLARYHTTVTYTTGTHEGRGLYTFRASEPGTYEVRVDGEEFPSSTIAVGRGVGTGFVGPVLGASAVGTLGVIGAVTLAIVVGVRRSHNRRALFANYAPGPPAAWPPQPGYPYPGAPPPPGPQAPPQWGAPPPPPPAPPAGPAQPASRPWGSPPPPPAEPPGRGQSGPQDPTP